MSGRKCATCVPWNSRYTVTSGSSRTDRKTSGNWLGSFPQCRYDLSTGIPLSRRQLFQCDDQEKEAKSILSKQLTRAFEKCRIVRWLFLWKCPKKKIKQNKPRKKLNNRILSQRSLGDKRKRISLDLLSSAVIKILFHSVLCLSTECV